MEGGKMKNEFRISVPRAVRENIDKAASEKGISANLMARMVLCEKFGFGMTPSAEAKTYTFSTRTWQELEAYTWMRNMPSVEAYIPMLLDFAISKNKTSPKQKALMESFIEKLKQGASECVRTASTGEQNDDQ
jgi:hypothetical protein